MLDLLLKQEIDYVVIEGFKQKPFPKIVIGSLTIDHCILTNPEVEKVIASLDLFADYPKLTERNSG